MVGVLLWHLACQLVAKTAANALGRPRLGPGDDGAGRRGECKGDSPAQAKSGPSTGTDADTR